MTKIERVVAREVLDSRGQPTVEAEIHCRGGAVGRAIAPSGASTGRFEAVELRDGDRARYDGRGVRKAVEGIHRVLGPALIGQDPRDQAALDWVLLELDGTPQKSRLGANALLAVSLAAAHAAAQCEGLPLYGYLHLMHAELVEALRETTSSAPPVSSTVPPASATVPQPTPSVIGPRMPLPMVNLISGGLHAGGNLDFQDFLGMPVGAQSYSQGLEWIVRVYQRLGELLSAAGYEGRLVGDEGGFGPRLKSNAEACELIVRAIERAGLRPGHDITIALDVASSHFYREGMYRLKATGEASLTAEAMIEQLETLVDAFPIQSIEDGLAEDDWAGWQRLTARLGSRVKLVGDDLFVTHANRLQRGIASSVANSVLVKLNQVGTLTETLRTAILAAEHGYERVVSARSGETEDTTMSDLAVGIAAEKIKIGSIVRGERLAKYNRLLRIDEELALAARTT